MTSAKDARKQLNDLLGINNKPLLETYLEQFEEKLQQSIKNKTSKVVITIPDVVAKDFVDALEYHKFTIDNVYRGVDIFSIEPREYFALDISY
ncbi:MAG: hypothetical protein K0R54_2763 [Clostridiaceae bacterium]|nr:hypothetical protein [Clostridiaceae bacterium]MDF2950481.1 hypothetical protein [Anaerocolumna sp.]